MAMKSLSIFRGPTTSVVALTSANRLKHQNHCLYSGVEQLLLWLWNLFMFWGLTTTVVTLAPANRLWHWSHCLCSVADMHYCATGNCKQTMALKPLPILRALTTTVVTLALANRPWHQSLCSGDWKLLVWLWHQQTDHGIEATAFV